MNYLLARPRIHSGDLLAWGHDAWRTWHDFEVQAVRFFTRSEYAHVGVAWVVGERVLVLEAVVPQVRIFPLSKLLPCHWFHGEHRIAWTPEIEASALYRVGEKYSKWEAVKSVLGRIVPGANAKWQCAELVAYIRSHLFIEDMENPTPTALVADALKRGATHLLLTNGGNTQ